MSGGYDAATALVVVDVQNAFVHPDGALHVAGIGDLVVDPAPPVVSWGLDADGCTPLACSV